MIAFAGMLAWSCWRFVEICRGYWSYTVDDAWITLRQARNLAEGHGFVYNPGGPRVESYTNHLLFLWQAFVIWLGGDGLFWTKVLGIAAGVVTILGAAFLAWLIAARFREADAPRMPLAGLAAAPLLLAQSPLLFTGSVSGLETSLFAALVTWGGCFCLLLLEARPPRGASLAAGLLLGLATWTRPEGIAWLTGFVGAVACVRLIGKQDLRSLLPAAATGLSFWLVLTGWRLLVFGHPHPNTYYAKMGLPLSMRLAGGSAYVGEFLFAGAGVWLLLAMLPGFIPCGRMPRRALGIIAASSTCGVLLAWYEGGDWIPHLRLIAPATGLMAGAAAASLALVAGRVPKVGRVLAVIVPLASWQAHFHVSMQGLRNAGAEVQTRIWGWNDAHKPLAMWLGEWNAQRAAADKEPLVVAIEDIGLVGWYGRVEIVDLAGLADPVWAHMRYEDHDAGYPAGLLLRERKPDVVVILSQSGHREPVLRIEWLTNRAVYEHPEFLPNFTEVAMFTHKDFPGDGLFLHAFVRNSLLAEVPKVVPPVARAVGH